MNTIVKYQVHCLICCSTVTCGNTYAEQSGCEKTSIERLAKGHQVRNLQIGGHKYSADMYVISSLGRDISVRMT